MLPLPRPVWAIAALSLVLTASLSAALQAPPAFATVGVGASGGAALGTVGADASVDVAASAEAPAPGAVPLAARNASSPPPPGNETRPPPPTNETRPPEEGPVAAPVVAPEYQRARGVAGRPLFFGLVVENPGDAPQRVKLAASGPAWWRVTLSPDNLTLAPGASAAIEGRIDTRPGLGGEGLVRIVAFGPGGNDTAIVDACLAGAYPAPRGCGERPPPPTNQTPRDPSNRTPPRNDTPPDDPSRNKTPPDDPPRCQELNCTNASAPASDPTPATPPAARAQAWVAAAAKEAEAYPSTSVDVEV